MKSAAVSQIKASLSEYLARVKKGEEVVVTDRGHPVAILSPFRESKSKTLNDRKRLFREGVIDLGKTGKIPPSFLIPSSVKDPKDLLLKALLEEREDSL